MNIDYEKVISFSRLKEVLQEKGVKSKELAEKIGKRPNNISMVINGEALPKTDFIAKICWVLNVSVDDICVFEGITPNPYQAEWYEKIGVLYKPELEAVGEVTYRPLRRLLELSLKEQNEKKGSEEKITADDFFDKVEAPRRASGAYDKSGKGIKAALESRGYSIDEKADTRNRRDYSKGLPYPTRTKLRQDKPLNIRTIYNICKVLGCTPKWVMSYK